MESWGSWDVRPSEAADFSDWDILFDEGLKEARGLAIGNFVG